MPAESLSDPLPIGVHVFRKIENILLQFTTVIVESIYFEQPKTSASHLSHEEITVIPPSNLEGKSVSQISKGI